MRQDDDARWGNKRNEAASGRGTKGSARLAAALGRIGTARRGAALAPAPFDLKPSNAFEVAVAEQIKAMRQDLDRLEARLWWLFALIVGAAVTNVALSLFS